MKIKENIKVAIMCTVMPFAIGFLLYKHSHYRTAMYVLISFLTVAFLSLIIPKFGNFVHKKGKQVGSFLGRYIAIVILFIGYIVAVMPTGFLMKIVKRDRLRLKKQNLQSYWVENENNNTDYELQY
ncbi:hypothetical protein IJ182_08210 [bacterium]|nr:hypothetical protein [bacterium]